MDINRIPIWTLSNQSNSNSLNSYDVVQKITKTFDNFGKTRLNYLKFLVLVLRLIESEVEFDVYHSFLLSSIVIAIEFEYLHK
jgi:hypothetical protein